ncbi:MAG: hypothetical protein L0Y70_29530 [Gemmataceae bacterium]|nr:hypothetical protein [Gemmataceae bacterium]
MVRWLKTFRSTVRLRQLALEMLVALSLAFLVWLYAHSRSQNSIDHVSIPVHIELAPAQRDHFLAEVGGSPHITVSFSGSSSRIRELRRMLQRGLVKATHTLTVSEERTAPSFTDNITIGPSDIPVPYGILVELGERYVQIPVTVHRLVERTLPVKLDYSGEVYVSQLKIEPAAVLVRGPKHVLDQAQFIATQTYALAAPTDGAGVVQARGQVDLVGEMEGRGVTTTPRQVAFRCKVQPRLRSFEMTDVPVRFLCPPNFPWHARFDKGQQGKVKLRLIGPAGEENPPVLAFVDLTGAQLFRGRNLEPLRLQLPKDFTLVQSTPPVIAFQLEEPDRQEMIEKRE